MEMTRGEKMSLKCDINETLLIVIQEYPDSLTITISIINNNIKILFRHLKFITDFLTLRPHTNTFIAKEGIVKRQKRDDR